MKQDAAEVIALKCLTWLVGQDSLLPVFLSSTGADSEELQRRAHDPDFLTSVLEFITLDDTWVVECCDDRDLRYEMPMMAMAVLQGAGRTHWT
ncbi:DUF3572 family protein [Pseudooceanicola sp. 216_PA32_1]|uniref:DUF3572 family protein n=2 Tax=Pseudooceanicola pacificus TaxID=2676438 RepID=A0A844WGB4_9RHOB|nr:DUF3572 family protein [Pseudooceanicola pacificus]